MTRTINKFFTSLLVLAMILALLPVQFSVSAQTALSPGDIAIIGVNADNPDDFAFVVLVDIDAGTTIRFTDSGWLSAGAFRANEGAVKYTAPSAITAGTIISYIANATDFVPDNDSDVGTSGFALSADGDQVIAFQGASNNPSFIYAVQTNSNQWQTDATASTNSALPTGLINGTTAAAVGAGSGAGDEYDNAVYDMSTTSGTQAEILAAVGSNTNWSGNNSPLSMPTGGFTVGSSNPAPADPVINEFSASTTGSPDIEYVEVLGDPSTDYSAFTVIEIEGDSNSSMGNIDRTFSIGTTDGGGFWTTSVGNLSIENGTITLLLVNGFTGSVGDDIDTDDDGVIDFIPWVSIADSVAVNDGGAGDLTYGLPVLGPNYDGVSSFAPGGASRIPDGFDTDAASDWVRNDFDLAGIPSFPGTITLGEAYNTPGAPNEIYVLPPEACGDVYTPIFAVQGNGPVSPLVGSEVALEGVVVGDFQNNASTDSGNLNGFFVQDIAGDGDSTTSDAIFVYASGAMDVSVGDAVRVRGTVSEYHSLTEISASQVWHCSTGNSVPAPVSLSLPVSSVDDFEAYEGMLVTFPQELVISEYFNYDRYGEIVLTTHRHLTPTAEYEPGSPEALQAMQDYLLDKVTLDDSRSAQNPDPAIHPNGDVFDLTNLFRGGDLVANVTGLLDQFDASYRVQPTKGADYTPVNLRTELPEAVGGNIMVASANVLNYFTTLNDRGANTTEEFERQRTKIIAELAAIDADVVGLMEIENNTAAIADLVAGLNDAMSAGTYAYVDTGVIGTDAIKVAFIYKPGTVSLVGGYAILDSSVDARFIDTKNRPALAQTYIDNETGGVFTVVVNHLKSKGSDCNDVGDPDLLDGAGNCNLTRKAAAEALVDWLATDPTGSGDNDYLIIGDLNSYDKEDPIDAILAGADDTLGTADDYTDMNYTFQGEYAYSYVFDGQVGYLDHALASAGLVDEITRVTEWHINADEPDLIDYDMTYKLDAQDALYEPNAYRASDHDPIIIGMELTTEAEIYELIDDIQKLVEDGTLNGGQGNALISKLENVLAKLARGNTNAAANQLGAFINQVEDYIYYGILTTKQGDALIKTANLLIGVLSN